jgi:hypothetical protein
MPKTLKEIDICGTCKVEHCSCFKDPCECETKDWCIHKDLRKEAIAWIKELEDIKDKDGQPKYYCKGLTGMDYTEDIIKFIKHFFNITEEDLNE